MALTINTHPDEVIVNEPEFDVSTSLTEDASHQNLRIRATIYLGGETEAVAVLEQPYGLTAWDFFKILKDFIGKCNAAVGSAGYAQPTVSAELLTGWTNWASDLFTTFASSGREITSAIDASSGSAVSNDLGSAIAGDVYVIGIEEDYTDGGAAHLLMKLINSTDTVTHSQIQYSGLLAGKLQPNHIYFLMARDTETTPTIMWNGSGGSLNGAGTFAVRKISDYKNNPGLYFQIKFEEVYENLSDVTTIGAEEYSDVLLFVPVILRPGELFANFLLHGSSNNYLARTELVSGSEQLLSNYVYGIDMEARVMGLSIYPYLRLTLASYTTTYNYDVFNPGWFMFKMYDAIGNSSHPYWYFHVQGFDQAFSSQQFNGPTVRMINEDNCYPDVRAISFVGDLGEETIIFKGLPSETGKAEKSFYKNVQRIPKVLNAFKMKEMTLRTLYETEELRRLLHELLYAELPVWMYNGDFTDGYRIVTILSDELRIIEQKELIESEIDMVFYE